MNQGFPKSWAGVVVTLALLTIPRVAQAHRDDYINETFVYQTLDAHEFEIELWGDARWPAGKAVEGEYTGAFEYGLGPRWMVDAAVQVRHDASGLALERLRAETRRRFGDEGSLPVDLAASLEYEVEQVQLGQWEHVVTPRLVVSKDVGPNLNTTLNLDLPVTVAPAVDVAFAYSIGVRYPAAGLLRGGVEVHHEPLAAQATLFPQLWFALPEELTFKLGAGIGLTPATVPILLRGVLEVEF